MLILPNPLSFNISVMFCKVDHSLLVETISSLGFWDTTLFWFVSYIISAVDCDCRKIYNSANLSHFFCLLYCFLLIPLISKCCCISGLSSSILYLFIYNFSIDDSIYFHTFLCPLSIHWQHPNNYLYSKPLSWAPDLYNLLLCIP